MDTTSPLYLPDGKQNPKSGDVAASGPGAGGEASAETGVISPEGTGPLVAGSVTASVIVNQGDQKNTVLL